MNTAAGVDHLVHVRQTNERTDSLSNIWSGVLLVLQTGEATPTTTIALARSLVGCVNFPPLLLPPRLDTQRTSLSHFEDRLRDERRGGSSVPTHVANRVAATAEGGGGGGAVI